MATITGTPKIYPSGRALQLMNPEERADWQAFSERYDAMKYNGIIEPIDEETIHGSDN